MILELFIVSVLLSMPLTLNSLPHDRCLRDQLQPRTEHKTTSFSFYSPNGEVSRRQTDDYAIYLDSHHFT